MNKNVKIGKFTLESLTTGMYSDPKIIFREYIQNSTDAVDDAIKYGLLDSREDGRIDIQLDKENRNVSIVDNGTGINHFKTWNTLCDIGDSRKNFSKQRGFRGIGRLGGLSYADELKFITSAKGENKKSIITWDCLKLKKLLRPGSYENYDLSRVVKEVTSLETKDEDDDEHYFEVKLINVEKQYSELLDEKLVKKYISQVAPIPFHAQHFFYYNAQDNGLKKKLELINKPLEEYYVYVNHDPNPLYKPYKTYVRAGKGKNEKRDSIRKIKYIQEADQNGELLFWGWYAITGFLGFVKDKEVAGIRVRKKNIQIGGIKTLEDCFTETRFNKWFIGEIYVYDEDVIPNARRDDFEKNDAYLRFIAKVEKYTKNVLSKIPRAYSNYNSATKKIEKKADELKEIEEKVKKGISSEVERKELHKKRDEIDKEIENSKNKLEKAKTKIDESMNGNAEELLEKASELQNKTKTIENGIIDADYQIIKSKALAGYSKKEKNIVIKIFEIIDRELESELAKKLEMNIIDNLKQKGKKEKK